jgi:hypothetical protein
MKMHFWSFVFCLEYCLLDSSTYLGIAPILDDEPQHIWQCSIFGIHENCVGHRAQLCRNNDFQVAVLC